MKHDLRTFSANSTKGDRNVAQWWAAQNAARDWFRAEEERFAPSVAQALGLRNAAAILPRDAWLELDGITRRVIRSDEGQAWMADLMPLAKTVNIGKVVQLNRVSSDAGAVIRSVSGQRPTLMDKVIYDYRGTPVPIFSTGYGRAWREWNSYQSENFDAISDDQEAHVAKIRRDQALYVLNGDTSINVGGYVGYGIRTSPYSKAVSMGAVDLTSPSLTAQQAANFWSQTFGAVADTNLVREKVNVYISPEIARNFDRPVSDGAGLVLGTIETEILKGRRVAKFVVSFELTGNQWFAFVPRAEYIRPLVGMAVNTVAIARTNPFDDYNFHVWGALGLEIRADYSGKSGVFYSTT